MTSSKHAPRPGDDLPDELHQNADRHRGRDDLVQRQETENGRQGRECVQRDCGVLARWVDGGESGEEVAGQRRGEGDARVAQRG